MKVLFFCCVVLCPFILFGQKKTTSANHFSFESPLVFSDVRLYKDTVSNPANIWQIGQPHKGILNTAFSPSNVIITDTVNAYPANDTSSFIVLQLPWYGWVLSPHFNIGLRGYYFVDSDSLKDFGTIDISVDDGQSWINLLDDTLYNLHDSSCIWSTADLTTPVLTGSSGGWKAFGFSFCTLADSFQLNGLDTILLRFSFMSDSVQTNKDGLMFDDLTLDDWVETIVSTARNSTYVAPNPATDHIDIITSDLYNTANVKVFDFLGRVILTRYYSQRSPITIPVGDLPTGIYNYSLDFDDGRLLHNGRFLKQ